MELKNFETLGNAAARVLAKLARNSKNRTKEIGRDPRAVEGTVGKAATLAVPELLEANNDNRPAKRGGAR